MKGSVCVIVFGFVFTVLLLPVASGAQCSYLSLITGNSNHPNGVLCWPPNSKIGYYYSDSDEPFYGAGMEVKNAASSWSAPSGYSIVKEIIGEDGNIVWITDKDSWSYYGHSPNAAAATIPYLNSSETYLNGFLIHMNCAYILPDDWSGSCEADKIDLETVMLHEFGHVFGLSNVTLSACEDKTVMYYFNYGDCLYLHDIDKSAIKYLCDNSGGRLAGFKALLMDAAVELTWEIIAHNTDHYRLERRLPGEDSFGVLEGALFYPGAAGAVERYVYVDPHGTPDAIYRLSEQEEGGQRVVHAIEKPLLPFEYDPDPPLTFDPDKVEAELEQWGVKSNANRNAGSRGEATTGDWVAIGPAEYVDSYGISSLAFWHEAHGMTTGVTDLQYIDDNWGGDLKGYISYLYEHGTQYVVLVGDASDHELWDDVDVWSVNGWDEVKPGYPSQPEYDIIPADYYLDQEYPNCSMSYFTPYYASELPKSDVDDDGYPELVIGRIPAHDVNDVRAYGAKAVRYLRNPSGPWVEKASVWIDCRHISGNDGYVTDSLGMDLVSYLPADFDKHVLKDSPCPDCYGYEQREAMAINEFNEGRSIIISFGNVANRYRLNDWFVVQLGFTVSMLDANEIFPFLLAVSCDQGAYDEAESSDGHPICERLLFDDKRGAIGVFAPTRGSWQRGNYLMAKFVLEYLYDKGAQSLGHACLAAQRDLMWQEECYRDLARSYVYLGDPALFLSGAVPGEITAVDGGSTPRSRFYLKANYPNPFNPSTTVEYSIARAGRVDLRIYDVAGRLVKVLESGTKQAGAYRVGWDGTNMKGERLASGIYFCRLKVEGEESLTRKMVLMR